MNLCPSVQSGLYFTCTQCGKCCSKEQEGYIFIFQDDVDKISANLKISEEKLAEKYLSTTDYEFTLWDDELKDTQMTKVYPTLILNNERNQDCIFLFEKSGRKLCKIYQSRPSQCKLFPFWNLVITSEENFISTSHSCPGLNSPDDSVGLYSPEKIKELVHQERQVERDFYIKMRNNDFDINRVYSFLQNISYLSKKK